MENAHNVQADITLDHKENVYQLIRLAKTIISKENVHNAIKVMSSYKDYVKHNLKPTQNVENEMLPINA
jgi:hypothetical protein